MDPPDGGLAAQSRALQIIYAAMLTGVGLVWGLAAFFAFQGGEGTPSPESLRLIKMLALAHAGAAPVLWLAAAKAAPLAKNAMGRAILSVAILEGAAMLGAFVGLFAAIVHVLPEHREYWFNIASYAVMAGWCLGHWPTEDCLRERSDEAARGIIVPR